MSEEPPENRPPKPPGPPWIELPSNGPPEGVLSYYHSEDQAAVPIRAVMRANDNKSDPNIETGTYGLFSTCSQRTRSGIVSRCTRYMFFVTQRGGGRMLTGYYRLKWYAHGNLPGNDFAVAADHIHFLDPGIPLNELPENVRARCTMPFRLSLTLDSAATQVLLDFVDRQPNGIHRYYEELDRIERRNMHLTAFRYVAWRRKEPFTWNDASRYLNATNPPSSVARRRMQSRSGKWRCNACDQITQNAALLKLCPCCRRSNTLEELEEPIGL